MKHKLFLAVFLLDTLLAENAHNLPSRADLPHSAHA